MPRRKPGQPPKPKPILPASGRPSTISRPGVPQRRLVITDLGQHAGGCLDAIKRAMHAAGVTGKNGGEPYDSDAVRFALWLAVSTMRGWKPEFTRDVIVQYRERTKGGPGA